jgi:hypothetical protein
MTKVRYHHANTKQKAIRHYLLVNPNADNATVVKDLLVSKALVTKVRSELRKEGLVGYAPNDRWAASRELKEKFKFTPTAPGGSSESPDNEIMVRGTNDLMDLAASQGVDVDVDPKEFLRTLTRFIRDVDLNPATRMAAMQQYTKIKADLLGRDAIGPGAPLTIEDQIVRLSLLMKAVGMTTAVRAMEAAFPRLKESTDEPPQVDEATTPVGSTEVIESSGPSNQENAPISLRTDDMGTRAGEPEADHRDDPNAGEPAS